MTNHEKRCIIISETRTEGKAHKQEVNMIYIVRWYDDSYIATYKKYSRKAAAVKFASKLDTDCTIDIYDEYGEYISTETYIK